MRVLVFGDFHWRTSKCPPLAASAYAKMFQPQPLAVTHWRTSKCPSLVVYGVGPGVLYRSIFTVRSSSYCTVVLSAKIKRRSPLYRHYSTILQRVVHQFTETGCALYYFGVLLYRTVAPKVSSKVPYMWYCRTVSSCSTVQYITYRYDVQYCVESQYESNTVLYRLCTVEPFNYSIVGLQ